MKTKTILAITFIVPLLVLACNRAEQSPTASTNTSAEKQVMTSSSPNKMLENSPPAAGTQPSSPDTTSTPPAPSATTDTPADQAIKPKSGGY